MEGAIIILVMILSCVIGYLLNSSYENTYNDSAINWYAFTAQCLFLLCAMLTWPNPDVTGWFVLWCILTIISYIIAFILCKKHAEMQNADKSGVNKAILAQMLLPIGTAIILLIIAMILGVFGGGKKKKK